MAINNIADGESGLSVRTEINRAIDQLNTYTDGQAIFTGAGAASSTKTAIFRNSTSFVSLNILDDGSVFNSGGNGEATNVAYGRQVLIANTTGVNNSMYGHQAGTLNTTGGNNTGIGHKVLTVNVGGAFNTGVGSNNLAMNDEGSQNTGIGYAVLNSNTTGSANTSLGYLSGFTNIVGSNSVFLGANSGYYETDSNKLFIDNAQRTNEADGRVKALVYGVFASTVSAQRLSINGSVGIGGAATSTSTLNISNLPTSSAGLASGDIYSDSGVLTIV
jgi:hypothetical protein